MALRQIDHTELGGILRTTIVGVGHERPVTAALLQLLYNTGLRINEVLEVERWQANGPDSFSVQLSKREETREIAASSVPDSILDHYTQQQPYILETYSAVNNAFRRHTPGLVIEKKKKTTLLHAFRYFYIKSIHASGLSLADVAAHMGHKVQASTAGYILGQVWAGE